MENNKARITLITFGIALLFILLAQINEKYGYKDPGIVIPETNKIFISYWDTVKTDKGTRWVLRTN